MDKKKSKKFYTRDGGYGVIGNMNIYRILSSFKDDDERKDYEAQLKEKNPKAYEEYKEYEALMEKYGND